MDCILAHAEEWGVDKERIAVAGFSAGGHLAACAATIAKHKPRAAIIAYGALTKETVALCGKDIPLPVDLIDENTAPCFVFGTRTDNVAPVANSLAFTQNSTSAGSLSRATFILTARTASARERLPIISRPSPAAPQDG